MSKYIYSDDVYNLKSPGGIVPIIFKSEPISSVLDVGCGTGTWLKACQESGVADFIGIDRETNAPDGFHVSRDKYMSVDLSNEFNLGRKFDLVVCLEVAEHLPTNSADSLVTSLVNHSDLILFSAAIPNQGGQHHLNEQWPIYWQQKFHKHDYYFEDSIRAKIWDDVDVDWWYKQNIFIVRKGASKLLTPMPSLVHPQLFELTVKRHLQSKEDFARGRVGLKVIIVSLANGLIGKIKSWLSLTL